MAVIRLLHFACGTGRSAAQHGLSPRSCQHHVSNCTMQCTYTGSATSLQSLGSIGDVSKNHALLQLASRWGLEGWTQWAIQNHKSCKQQKHVCNVLCSQLHDRKWFGNVLQKRDGDMLRACEATAPCNAASAPALPAPSLSLISPCNALTLGLQHLYKVWAPSEMFQKIMLCYSLPPGGPGRVDTAGHPKSQVLQTTKTCMQCTL